MSDIIELHYIELSKFKSDKPAALRTRFEKWLHLLKFSQTYDSAVEMLPKELTEEEGILMTFERMQRASSSEEVQQLIEAQWKAELDYTSGINAARREGVAQGIEEGVARGIEQGLALGIEQARARLRESARQLMELGLSRPVVATKLGLAEDEF